MIRITNNSDSRSDLQSVGYAHPANLTFVDYPGSACECVGDFESIRYSVASLTEDDAVNGDAIQQELSILVRGQNKETDDIVTQITGIPLILKLGFSNGDTKILGTKDNPVVLSSIKSESPLATTLTCSRLSAEKAKYLLV